MFKQLVHLWARLTNGRAILLLHTNGDVTHSIARRNQFGQLTAKVHWPYDIYNVVLLADGTCRGNAPHSYVKRWKLCR